MADLLKEEACNAIESRSEELHTLSMDIWNNPELMFQEFKAHDRITNYLEQQGFQVSRKTPMETAFVARFGNGNGGPKIGVMCEYDALPGIGHACGHNLIAQAGVAAGIGIKSALESGVEGEVIVFGTPAEEGGGGKITMVEKGVFDDCDVCMMIHPAPVDIADPINLAICQMDITFNGKASHASTAPWDGVNALDAAVATYNAVSMLRQQLKPTSRVHGIFVDGGEKPNIIPRRSQMSYYMRGITNRDAFDLREKVMDCAKGAALATGCTVEFGTNFRPYLSLMSNPTLVNLYRSNATKLGVTFDPTIPKIGGSSDVGNVSHHRPTIEPKVGINANGNLHTEAFAEAAGRKENQAPILRAAKSIAYSGIDILSNPELAKTAREEFEREKDPGL